MSISESFLEELISRAPKEGEFWDFKREWYKPEKKVDLLVDVMNMVNTINHQDCYIIIGVDDKTGKVIGVDQDKHRMNRQLLQNFLRSKPFAQNYYPRTDVNTFKIYSESLKKNVEIDVITIFNENCVPIYLAKNASIKQNRPLSPGLIYSRVGDSNTERDKSTTDDQMEKLWRKRFHLDVSIYDRFKFSMQNPEQWEKIERIESLNQRYIWTVNPDFVIEITTSPDNQGKVLVTEYSCSQINVKLDWYKCRLIYKNNIILEKWCNSICGSRLLVICPIMGGIYPLNARFHYYIVDSLEYTISNFLIQKDNITLQDQFYKKFTKNILYFENKKELSKIIRATKNVLIRKPNLIVPTHNQILDLSKKIKNNVMNEGKSILLDPKRINIDYLTVSLMKKLQK